MLFFNKEIFLERFLLRCSRSLIFFLLDQVFKYIPKLKIILQFVSTDLKVHLRGYFFLIARARSGIKREISLKYRYHFIS